MRKVHVLADVCNVEPKRLLRGLKGIAAACEGCCCFLKGSWLETLQQGGGRALRPTDSLVKNGKIQKGAP